MIYRTYVFLCEDCFSEEHIFDGIPGARKRGWAVARNRQDCYCPRCAPSRRNVGLSKKTCKIMVPEYQTYVTINNGFIRFVTIENKIG